jgi:hypothetical protein
MELSAAKQQKKDQQEFKGILGKARVSEIDSDTANQLVNELSLQKIKHTQMKTRKKYSRTHCSSQLTKLQWLSST